MNFRVPSSFQSKLPDVGTTIFTLMSKMALDYGAINLSQGFPDFQVSEELLSLVNQHMRKGHNQYAPMQGVMALRERISEKIFTAYQKEKSPETEITVTSGGTEAIFAAVSAMLHPGDEAIILEPSYDCYAPAVTLAGGIPIYVSLHPENFSVNWQAVEEKISEKTRLIFINSPHNPSGSVLTWHDLEELARITRDRSIVIISDEVYENIIFDNLSHQSVLCHDELATRSVAVFSFGKTFHTTGWKVGYFVAPDWLTHEIRKVHQYVQFSVHTPSQFALADYLADRHHYENLSSFYQKKRDLFLNLMQDSPLRPVTSHGTYFQLFSYKEISTMTDRSLAEYLTKEVGVASIPISVFYHDKQDNHYLRFCFAKNDETLQKASEILRDASFLKQTI